MLKYNRYDYGVIILITLLAFGGLGGAFQPVRMFALLTSPLILFKLFSKKIDGQDKYLLFMLATWLMYAGFSFFWTPAPDDGAKQLAYYLLHFLMLLQLIFWLSKASKPTYSVILGWLFAAGLTLPMALYEINSGNHLFDTYLDSDAVINTGFEVIPYRYAATTFGDLNAYSVFLCYAIFFLFLGLLLGFSRKIKFTFIAAISIIGYVLIVNSSRGALLVYVTTTITFLVASIATRKSSHRGYSRWIVILITIVMIFITISYAASFVDLETYRIFYRFTNRSIYYDDARVEIYKKILKTLPDYNFFGAGVGSERTILEAQGSIVASSHNLLLEILLQYGIFIFFIFFIFVLKIIFSLYKKKLYSSKFLAFSLAFGLIPLSLVVSGYLLHPAFWIFLGSLYSIGKRSIYRSPMPRISAI